MVSAITYNKVKTVVCTLIYVIFRNMWILEYFHNNLFLIQFQGIRNSVQRCYLNHNLNFLYHFLYAGAGEINYKQNDNEMFHNFVTFATGAAQNNSTYCKTLDHKKEWPLKKIFSVDNRAGKYYSFLLRVHYCSNDIL